MTTPALLLLAALLLGAALYAWHDLRRPDSRLYPRLVALAEGLGLRGDVTAVACRPEHGECELSLTVRDRGDLTGFEVLRRWKDEMPWDPVTALPVGGRVTRVELPAFHTHEFLVRAIRLDGTATRGVVVRATGVHRRVTMDRVDGRPIQVYLPEEAGEPGRRFPVVYFHDGQNLFCDSTSYCGSWRADAVLEGLARRGLAGPMIAVGIYNGPGRAAEYVPYVDERFTAQTGVAKSEADAFAAFVCDRVVPHVEANHPALAGRENRMVAGSSFGGMAALWMGFTRPETFSCVGAFSPSIWAGSGEVFRDLPRRGNPGLKLWLDVGTAEWSPVARLADLLAANGFTYGRDLFYYEDPGAEHHERFWGARLASPLILFKGREPMEPVALEAVVERLPADRVSGGALRINAVATLGNGMRYTLLHQAAYEPADPATLSVSPTGDIEFLRHAPCAVTVRAGALERRVVVEPPAAAPAPVREGRGRAD